MILKFGGGGMHVVLTCSKYFWIWRMPSSEMWRRVALVRTNVSKAKITSVIRVTRIGELGITLAISSSWRILRADLKFYIVLQLFRFWLPPPVSSAWLSLVLGSCNFGRHACNIAPCGPDIQSGRWWQEQNLTRSLISQFDCHYSN
jgi:hypothetical protein